MNEYLKKKTNIARGAVYAFKRKIKLAVRREVKAFNVFNNNEIRKLMVIDQHLHTLLLINQPWPMVIFGAWRLKIMYKHLFTIRYYQKKWSLCLECVSLLFPKVLFSKVKKFTPGYKKVSTNLFCFLQSFFKGMCNVPFSLKKKKDKKDDNSKSA